MPESNKIKNLSYSNKEWILPKPVPPVIRQELGDYPALIQQILYNRGYEDAIHAELFLQQDEQMLDPFLLSDLPSAVERIQQAIQTHENMVVYGDFDVDGITGTALLTQALQELGAHVQPYIPDRFAEGYGLNMDAMRSLAELGTQVLVTVDCGIRSIEEVRLAQELGMDVILTDHHLPGESMPPAIAVICQKKDDEVYPNYHIAGVGLAYKLMMALFQQYEKSKVDIEKYLDLVALGTVADVVSLVGENRAFVKQGLEIIHAGKRPGLRALIAESGIASPAEVTSEHIGFRIGPRLNAAGRLDSAMLAWRLLTTSDADEAMALAATLNNLNVERRGETESAYEIAISDPSIDKEKRIIFTVNEDFHEGIVGLVASKLCEEYYLPAIVGTNHNGLIRASCRSIPEFHITQTLDRCADLLVQYGGHSMAAGLTVEKKNLEKLKENLSQIALETVDWESVTSKVWLDGEVQGRDMNGKIPDIMRALQAFEPTGEGNRKPLLLMRGLKVEEKRQVGSLKNHLKLKLRDGYVLWDAIAFRMGGVYDFLDSRVDIAFHYAVNDFNGGLQLVVRDMRPADS